MVKAVRLDCYQNMPCYRKPTAIAIQESYRLPPYSSVIGMVHAACGFKEYHPMRVSIQGKTQGSLSDMYTRYYFGLSFDPERHQRSTLREDGKRDGITRGLGYAELIVDAQYVFHIIPDCEEDLARIVQGLKKPCMFPSLGRHEDILRIDSVRVVELQESAGEEELSLYGTAYIPLEQLQGLDPCDLSGSVVTLNKRFEITPDGKNRRWTERVRAKAVQDIALQGAALYDDSDPEKLLGVFPA